MTQSCRCIRPKHIFHFLYVTGSLKLIKTAWKANIQAPDVALVVERDLHQLLGYHTIWESCFYRPLVYLYIVNAVKLLTPLKVMSDQDITQLDATLDELDDIYQTLKFSRDQAAKTSIKADESFKVDNSFDLLKFDITKVDCDVVDAGIPTPRSRVNRKIPTEADVDTNDAIINLDNNDGTNDALQNNPVKKHEGYEEIVLPVTPLHTESKRDTVVNIIFPPPPNYDPPPIRDKTNSSSGASLDEEDYDPPSGKEDSPDQVYDNVAVENNDDIPDYDDIPEELEEVVVAPGYTDEATLQYPTAVVLRHQTTPLYSQVDRKSKAKSSGRDIVLQMNHFSSNNAKDIENDENVTEETAVLDTDAARYTNENPPIPAPRRIESLSSDAEWSDDTTDNKSLAGEKAKGITFSSEPTSGSTQSIIDATQSEYMRNKTAKGRDREWYCYLAMLIAIVFLIGLFIFMFISYIYVGTVSQNALNEALNRGSGR